MIGYELDDRMKRLLREIYQAGKKRFNPDEYPGGEREFDKDTKCLEKMVEMRLIDSSSFKTSQNRRGGPHKYDFVLVLGLTYDGQVAAEELELAPSAGALVDLLSYQGLLACRRDFERAVASVASDPAQAITGASSALESVCKEILSLTNQPLPKDQSIQPLVKATMKALDLAPEDAAEEQLKRLLGAVGNISAAVGTLRTHYGSAHGRTNDHAPLFAVHARFAVNAMAAAALFLLEIAIDQSES